jgi:CRP/FNR family transcriptional regulator, cyclic AMP receptor protein
MRVEKAEMIGTLHTEPTFGEAFTAHLLTPNSRIEGDLVDQLFNSSEKRFIVLFRFLRPALPVAEKRGVSVFAL